MEVAASGSGVLKVLWTRLRVLLLQLGAYVLELLTSYALRISTSCQMLRKCPMAWMLVLPPLV